MLCHTKQVFGENSKKREVSDAENTSRSIRDKDTRISETSYVRKVSLAIIKTLKEPKLKILRGQSRFPQDNSVKSATTLSQQMGIIPITTNLSRCSFCVEVATEKKVRRGETGWKLTNP